MLFKIMCKMVLRTALF